MKTVDPAVVEFANDAFYLAFNSKDIDQMERLWAEEISSVCIHPGWGPLFGRDDILSSWQSIFAGQTAENQILCVDPRVVVQGDVYSVLCYERLPAGWLMATNNFMLENGIVRMVHHQAGQCMDPPESVQPTQTLQ